MNSDSSSSEEEKDLPQNTELPISIGRKPGPIYISPLCPDNSKELTENEEEWKEDGLRLRKRGNIGSGSTKKRSVRRRNGSRKKYAKKRGVRQVLRDWNASFERGVGQVETWAEILIHYLFLIIEWILLTIQRIGTTVIGKFSLRWGNLFGERMHYFTRAISVEERAGTSARSREYIWILYEIRKKCMMPTNRRMYLYKTIVASIFLVTLLCIGLFYAADSVEYITHVRYMHIDHKTGREIMNMLYVPDFPRDGFNEDIEWLLYTARKQDTQKTTFLTLDQPMLLSNYVEIATRRFGRVNISISEMVQQMEDDSKQAGNGMLQPCLCPAHYGISLNIVLVRYSLENNAKITGKRDVVYYEPRISSIDTDSIKGGLSMDTLVVSRETRMKFSGGLSPLEADFAMKLPLGVNENQEEHRTLVVDLTDIFSGNYHGMRITASNQQKKMLFERTRNMVTQDVINGLKKSMSEYLYNGEISIAYSNIGVRSLNANGEKLPLTYIESPYSYCVQRCLAAVNPYF